MVMSIENKVWTDNDIFRSLGAVLHKCKHFHGFWESSHNCIRYIFKTVTQPRSRTHAHIHIHFLLTLVILHSGEHWIILFSLSQFAFHNTNSDIQTDVILAFLYSQYRESYKLYICRGIKQCCKLHIFTWLKNILHQTEWLHGSTKKCKCLFCLKLFLMLS